MEENSNDYLIQKFLGEENRNLNSRLNILNSSNITLINTLTPLNSIFIEYYAEMYYSFVIVRKFVYSNKEFLKNLLTFLLKIVHPNIQIFYGLIFTQDNIKNNNDIHDNVNLNFNCVFEYFNGIDLCNFDQLKPFINVKEEFYIKLLLADKIAQTISFIYKSGCPHLMLNGKNILINHNLIMNRHQHNKVIYSDNSYIYANIIKINEVGSFLKYDKKYKIYSIQNEDIYEMSFHSPEFLNYLLSKEKIEFEMNNEKLEKFDVWSYGCLLYELFFEKRPFQDIFDKNSLIKIVTQINENNSFFKLNKSENKFENNSELEIIVKLIETCTTANPKERLDFSQIVDILINTLKKFREENFTNDEIESYKKKIEDDELNYFDFPKFDNINNITKLMKTSEILLGETKFLENEIEEFENEYNQSIKEIENMKFKQQFNKDNFNTNTKQNSYFIKNLFFSEVNNSNNIYIFDVYKENTFQCKLTDQNLEETFTIPNNSSIYFSLNKKKLFLSGGFKTDENLNHKRKQAFGFFYTEDDDLLILKNDSKKKTTSNIYKSSSPKNITKKNFSKISNKLSITLKISLLSFQYSERSYKISEISTQDEITTEDKNLYYNQKGKNLIKRSNHSIIEIENYLFFIGGDQSRKCEILDLTNDNFYFIEELNYIHKNPILYKKENKIFSLNFDGVVKYHSELEESFKTNFNSSIDNFRKRTNSVMIKGNFNLPASDNFSSTKFIKRNSINNVNNNNFLIKNNFCESFDTSEMTQISKWKIEEIKFNLGENFNFDKLVYYKYLIINDVMIFIIGSDRLFDHEDNSFRLFGVCFNITNLEFTVMDKRTLLKLDPLKSCLGMSSNIIYHNENFYYLNCVTKKVEKLHFDSLFK